MPASTPWWSTPSTAAPRPGRRPTLGLAAAIVASVLSGATMADPLKTSALGTRPVSASKADQGSYAMYAAPNGIDRGTCDRSKVSRDGSFARTLLVGAQIGRSMDQIDQACVARILEYAPDRAAIRWYGAAQLNYGGPAFAVTPLRTFERDGKFCREYQALATIAGHDEQSYGVACRMTDGIWQNAG
jgi:surface antigen